MRIGFVSRELPPRVVGGVGTYVEQISRALAAAGHEVHVFTAGSQKCDGDEVTAGVQVHRALTDPPEPTDAFLVEGWTKAGENLHYAARFREALLSFVQDQPLDLVEFPEVEAPGWLTLLDPAWTVPSVVNCHLPTWLLQELNEQPPLKGQNWERLQLSLADAVCAPTAAMAQRVQRDAMLAHRPAVVAHPCEADRVADSFTEPAGARIVFVGRLDRLKGVIELATAANRVLGERPDAELVLAGGDTLTPPGGGSMREYLVGLIRPGVRRRVRFLGPVSASELRRLYGSALFCVFPSYFENFPNVGLEAMAAGRGAVVGGGSGLPEVMGESAVAVPPRDAVALAGAMLELLGDRERCSELGRLGFVRVREHFASEVVAGQREAFYRKVVSATVSSSHGERIARVPPAVWCGAAPEIADAVRTLLADAPQASGEDVIAAAQRIIERLAPSGDRRRVALYGAGKHTRKVLSQHERLQANGIWIELILDDEERRRGETIAGVRVASPQEALSAGIDAVVLSSDAMESLLWQRSRFLREAGVAVVRLYGREDEREDG